jgi:hypothetical protein
MIILSFDASATENVAYGVNLLVAAVLTKNVKALKTCIDSTTTQVL